jgi:hypothetical protein
MAGSIMNHSFSASDPISNKGLDATEDSIHHTFRTGDLISLQLNS